MTNLMIIFGVVVVLCIILNKLTFRLGLPSLLIFMGLGMVFGSDGLFKVPLSDYRFVEMICSTGLIFIMFYGGFGTNWHAAKPVAVVSGILAGPGVVLTAVLTGLFCHYVLGFSLLEGMLLGSVVGSTDAASVFSILRSKKLNLRENTASLLEMESGSNDPFAYMLVLLFLTMANSSGSTSIFKMVVLQLSIGISLGALFALASIMLLKRFKFDIDGIDGVFVFAMAILSYAVSEYLGGNGYLSTYITGIIIGNSKIRNKINLVHFFDGITNLMQIIIFFLFGLLSSPSRLPGVFVVSVIIFMFMTFIARPVSVFVLMRPFGGSANRRLVVSWCGLRGASALVFAIVVAVNLANPGYDVFHIVFCIVLISISVQGTLLPWISRKLDMVDSDDNVFKTFNDYQAEDAVQFTKMKVHKQSIWYNKRLCDIEMLPSTLVAMIYRGDKTIVPTGKTLVMEDDVLVLATPEFRDSHNIELSEIEIDKNSEWVDKKVSQLNLPKGSLIVMIKRGDEIVVPNGESFIRLNDVLVIND